MKKVFCLILALAMVLTFMPMQTYAASGSRTISGTLTFSSPVKETTTIRVYATYAYGNFYSTKYEKIEVKKGATKMDFSISLAPNVYSIRFRGPNGTTYSYGVEDDLTTVSRQRMYFDLMEKSITGLNVNGDALMEESSGNVSANVDVVINFPERLTEYKNIFIIAGTEENAWDASDCVDVEAGATQITIPLYLSHPDEKYFFCYGDATDAYSNGDNYIGFLYGTENGVSSLRANAKLYDVSKGTVTITYPSSYTISGTLDRTGYADGTYASAYVFAEFADGEIYTARVPYGASETSKSFKIYVPLSQNGKTYTLYIAPADGIRNIGVMRSAEKSVGTYTLSGDKSVGSLTIDSRGLVKYSGTISLPSGIPAPTDYVDVDLYAEDDDYIDLGTYRIPAGSTSTNFSFWAEPGLVRIYAELGVPVEGAFYDTSVKVSDTSGIKLSFPKEAVISGTVYLPEGLDTAYSGSLYTNTSDVYVDAFFAIRHGEKSTKYYLHVPLGVELDPICLNSRYDSSEKIPKKSIFIDSNWQQTTEYPDDHILVTGNQNDVDIYLNKEKRVRGTIYRPAYALGSFDIDVMIQTDKGNSYTAEAYFSAENDSTEYSVLIPDSDKSTTYKLSYTNETNKIKTGTWYLKSDGEFTTVPTEAASFSISDKSLDFTPVPIDPFVKGKLYIPEDVADNTSLYVRLFASLKTDSGDYPYADTSFRITVDGAKLKTDKNGRYMEYGLGLEDLTEGGNFYLQYFADNEALDCNYYYVLADGSLVSSTEETYYLTFDGTTPVTINFTLLPWDDGNRYVFESAHGLKGETVTYTYTYPGECDSLTLTFNDRSNEKVAINGTEYPTADPVTIEGKKAEVTVEFGYNRDNRYGFACTDITASGVTKHKSGVAAVYTPNGDESKDVIEDLKDTNEISATFSTDGIEAGKKLMGHAALYDKDGRFLGLSKADDFVVDGSNAGMKLTFDEVSEDTVQVTVVVIDTDYKPMGDCMTK